MPGQTCPLHTHLRSTLKHSTPPLRPSCLRRLRCRFAKACTRMHASYGVPLGSVRCKACHGHSRRQLLRAGPLCSTCAYAYIRPCLQVRRCGHRVISQQHDPPCGHHHQGDPWQQQGEGNNMYVFPQRESQGRGWATRLRPRLAMPCWLWWLRCMTTV